MKITVKTVQQQTFQIETDANETIAQVKQKLQTASDQQASWQKLIFSGKVLEDSTTVGSLGIGETDFLVLMVRKPKETPASSTPSSTSAPAPAVTAPLPTPPADKDPQVAQSLNSSAPSVTSTPLSTPSPLAQQPSSSSPSSSADGSSGLVVGSDYEQTVTNLIEMGFTRENVIKALRAAFNNPDRAVEYLFNGIPETAEPQPAVSPSSPPSGTPAATGGSSATPASASSGESGAPTGEQQTTGGVFDFLRQHPQFAMLRQMVQQNPSLLQPVLQQLGQQNPELLQLINTHQQEFIQLLNSPASPASASSPSQGGSPGSNYVQVTQEEKAAIDRLTNLGFDRSAVIEAFFACDKDETLAANYLLENAGEMFEDEASFE